MYVVRPWVEPSPLVCVRVTILDNLDDIKHPSGLQKHSCKPMST